MICFGEMVTAVEVEVLHVVVVVVEVTFAKAVAY